MDIEVLKEIVVKADTKIVLLILDGLGGLPLAEGGLTELETAKTPNLDDLARRSECGLMDPVSPGIIPGSGPGHLSLFGYDPVRYRIGRGVLAALGVDFPLKSTDLAARMNFATADQNGIIVDRRAGRIKTERSAALCRLLEQIEIPEVEIFVRPVKEHRAVVVFRGGGLAAHLTDSDPQQVGLPPREVQSLSQEAERAAQVANEFIRQANQVLAHCSPANVVLLRGFDKLGDIPSLQEIYGVKAAAIASYPMYRGIAKLVGMEVLPAGETIEEEFDTLIEHFDRFDFFYLHIKQTDSAGEDGDFERKAQIIEKVDEQIPRLLALTPDVVVVTGDHSTPAVLRAHSWHPSPMLLYSKYCRPDGVKEFSERGCAQGELGRFRAVDLMPMIMANALRFKRFGA